MITLIATEKSRQDIEELATFFEGLSKPTPDMQTEVGDTVRRLFGQRFDNEGGPGSPWVGLTIATMRDREEQGYGAAHPILYRTGEYKFSFTGRGGFDNIENLITRATGWTLELGSSDFRVSELEGGRSSPTFMPPRPVTLLEASEESEIGDALDRIFQQAADSMGMDRG